jgi:hypothetical protein
VAEPRLGAYRQSPVEHGENGDDKAENMANLLDARASERRATRARVVAWCAIGTTILFLRAGVGSYPFAKLYASQVAPGFPHFPEMPALFQFPFNSPIGIPPAAALGIHTENAYDLMHLGFLALFTIATGWLVRRRWGAMATAAVGVAFVGSQAAVVCLYWLGSYDIFTVGLSSMLVAVRNRWAAGAIGFLLAFAAFEQGLLILLMLLALCAVRMHDGARTLVVCGAGLVVGRIVLWRWLTSNGIHYGRAYYFEFHGADHFLSQFWRCLPLLLLTGFGATVVLVAVAIWTETSWVTRAVPLLLLTLVLVPVAITEDQTRVFSILTWPLAMVLVLRYSQRARRAALRKTLVATLALAAIIPGVVIFKARTTLSTYHVLRVLRPW